ncbi:MAG: inorganic diphosphatase [Clostridiales bacterium]|nr:inorganic diphosphatase [Clostridiales bacterium]
MNLWHDISPLRMQPEDFIAVIEIEKGSKNKYEMDKDTGALRLDRILYTSTHYPANYGFLPRTYADDNDPLDVLVLCSEPIRPMSLVRVYPVGYFAMKDGDAMDEKILAIPFGDPVYNCYKDVSELPAHMAEEISHFFNVYKNLEKDKGTEIAGVYGREAAVEIIKKAYDSYIDTFCRSGGYFKS